MEVLIDGDILVYRGGFACEPRDEEGEVVVAPLSHCLHTMKLMVEGIINETGATSYRLFLTGKDNFRLKVDREYKANRKDARKPVYYQEIRNYLVNQWNAEIVNGEEADDALGKAQREDTIIASIDKDLMIVEGMHYNFVKKIFTEVDEYTGRFNFYSQMLTGDSTDNIAGLYNVGAAGARKLLEESDDWDKLIYDKYVEEQELANRYLDGEFTPKKMSEYAKFSFNQFATHKTALLMKKNALLLWIRNKNNIPINFRRFK